MRLLRIAAGGVVAELFDITVLSQAPARPDRMRAVDWALHAGPCPGEEGIEPLLQLAIVYLAAHTEPETGCGLNELDQMERA
ncbi:hypothetical protein [Streptomyces mirabilis]|uniref:hypothetical protein n=1 Tax=Streptomyces mirabilis TaxID=68239 RepID=UPI00331A377A